jgi:hypothetical protein
MLNGEINGDNIDWRAVAKYGLIPHESLFSSTMR